MILVVDDEENVRSMLVRAVRELGYEVRAAGDGETALAQIEAKRPDLVILDYVMPGMDGAEVAKAIADADATIPVVFSTGHSALRTLRNAAGEEASVLEKPFTLAELDALIKRVLDDGVA